MQLVKGLLGIFFFFPFFSLIAGDLEVEILNRKSNQSVILCALYETANGFLSDEKQASYKIVGVETNHQKTTCLFNGIPDKQYAVSVLEDLNRNGKMDTTFIGLPKEPWGVSRNPPMHAFGPPSFDEAVVNVKSKHLIQIKLNHKD
ncbi:DUF2141 domain-containing protein [Leptospira levettii]|uniref:DUF2141 domain-containing protein n=1 Tax=Leptospira levettii TaxID=2023178 RepID=UPI001082FC4C|nr:DUF2141 domain-containing protein [Leptospira levettii]MCW7497461.1 DUF2141 domain-containing protein [Leptospira levettii]TGM66259.1 DUF2141 domain-containing protein [Leptospira levettii]